MPHVVEPAPAIVPERVEVHRASTGDLDALVALEQRSFCADRMSRAQYRRHLVSETALVLIASAQRHLLGSAVLFFRKRSLAARLYSLATEPDARGRGVGRSLLDAVIAAARQRGYHVLRLEVRTDNRAAIALYERAGFCRMGSYSEYYEDGTDAWRYALPLTQTI
ncbi:MAG: N-acetyltransferase [Rhodanobacter sp.]